MGAPPPHPLPPVVCGLSVVASATALGVTFQAGTLPVAPDWDALLARVRAAFARVATAGLSAVGRGLTSAAYGVSRILFHAEFSDLPPPRILDSLRSATRALVLDVGGGRHAFLRVRSDFLCGAPSRGGWGCLAFRQHILARHACQAAHLLTPASAGKPWVRMALALLAAATQGGAPSPPPPLSRIVSAVCALPGYLPDRVAWQLPCGTAVTAGALTVRSATRLLLSPLEIERDAVFSVTAAACGVSHSGAAAVRAAFGRVWGMPWENKRKQIFWGLMYDAVPTSARLGGAVPCGICACAAPCRMHHFWACPAARAVVQAVQARLPSSSPPLAASHFWLVRPPQGACAVSWPVVALAALGAMDATRRFAWRRGVQALAGSLPASAAPLASAAPQFAVAWFWGALRDFCFLGSAPAEWRDLPHRFFRWSPADPTVPTASGAQGSWRVCRPAL